ncbi:MAG: Flp family type IVb pilin [Pacificimonas sp.]
MLNILKRAHRDEDGATAIEYGLLAAMIAVAALAGFQSFGDGLFNMWGKVETVSADAAERGTGG